LDEITVIYKSTTEEYENGYRLLQQRSKDLNIRWQSDTKFEQDFTTYLSLNSDNVFLGLTDDCVFYRQTSFTNEIIDDIFYNQDIFCCSLRLGLNTTLQDYIHHMMQPPLQYYYLYKDNFVYWNWKHLHPIQNYGYSISLDGHIYRCEDMLEIMSHFKIDSLRSWEHNLATNCRELTNKRYMLAETQSSVYCIPCNCCQEPSMIAGVNYPYSTKELNDLYLNGKIIDPKSIISDGVNWCHQEMPFLFKGLLND
jgi:hypothetical protein